MFWRRIGSVAALRAERDLPVSCCGQKGGGEGRVRSRDRERERKKKRGKRLKERKDSGSVIMQKPR